MTETLTLYKPATQRKSTFTHEDIMRGVQTRLARAAVRKELVQAGTTDNRSHEAKIRGYLSKALLAHAQRLVKVNHKLDLKDTVETASKLFGWGKSDQPGTLLQIGVVEKLDVGKTGPE